MAFVVNLDDELDRAVAVLAARLGCSKNKIVKRAVEDFLHSNIATAPVYRKMTEEDEAEDIW